MSDANTIHADVSGTAADGTPQPWRNVLSRHERGARDVIDDPTRGAWNSTHNGVSYPGHYDGLEQIVPIGEQISWRHTFSDGINRDLGMVLMELMEDQIQRRKVAGQPATFFPPNS